MKFELTPFNLPSGYGAGIVSDAEAKAQCHVLDSITDFDTEIGIYRDAAVDMVERYCGVRLDTCTDLGWRAEGLCSPLRLGVWPVTGITAVTWLDSDGATVAGDASIWRVSSRDEIRLKPGQSLPSGVAAGVTITFDAGFTDINRPPALKQAVLMFTAHLFKHREAVAAGAISGEVPLGFRHLCSAYRMPVI